FKGTWITIEYGAWFAQSMQMKFTLLGVTEKLSPAAIDDHHPLEDIFASAVELFQKKGVEYSLVVLRGDAEHVIAEKANQGDFLTVVSPLGRSRFRHWLTGRSFRALMEEIKGPILYVPEIRLPLKNLLISAGGLGYEVAAESLALQVATVNRADVTILHVIPPTDLDYPTTRDVREHVKDLQDTDTVLGRSLRKGLEIAKDAGLNAKLITRQGHVVEEILAEVQGGNYDMVCMGSRYSGHTLRQLYTPNVTAEVAEAANCPVLTVRHMHKEDRKPFYKPGVYLFSHSAVAARIAAFISASGTSSIPL
ncbi:MAG TPA: universal stress protein, partial [Anaerolineales bacterium]|nr:universal stress protein [Anaerolineales bacterium]